MLRAFLADRLKLVVRTESREIEAFALVVARSDRRLGAQILRTPTPEVRAPVPPLPATHPSSRSDRAASQHETRAQCAGERDPETEGWRPRERYSIRTDRG